MKVARLAKQKGLLAGGIYAKLNKIQVKKGKKQYFLTNLSIAIICDLLSLKLKRFY